MNPFWFAVKIGGMALVTVAGTALVMKKLCPKPADLMAGAIHFKKGFEEFHKGFSSLLVGTPDAPDPEAKKKRKEASRIRIE
ncbi:MAG: hypothetical protein V1792_12135 [Pseudomonadota bacterium]